MRKITSFEEVCGLMTEIRNLKKGFITNFYPDPLRISLWCQYGSLFYELQSDTLFFLREEVGFTYLYYCSSSEERLKESLIDFFDKREDRIWIVDLIGANESGSYRQLFTDQGFSEYTSLIRMSRINTSKNADLRTIAGINNADSCDVQELQLLLHTYFDPYAEQLPLEEEIIQWIEVGHLLVCRLNGKIVGFVIYDLSGKTQYLRYWFVHPDYRENGIGSNLWRESLFRGKDTRRQFFWVIQTNENAIKRYIHYGFQPEEMYDYILIKR